MKSKDWLNRQKNDYFVNKAKKSGYISRSAFKILEIENKYKFIENSRQILELGSSPGGWSQVIIKTNDKVNLIAFDILEMKFKHPQLTFFKEDFLNFNFHDISHKFELILSDVAPNTTGHQSTDHLRITSIIFDMISMLDKLALPSSAFVFKIWKGSEEKNIIKLLRSKYEKVSYFKPKSSRAESSEIYIVAEKFIL